MDDDLKDLIENPREIERIELKEWVDLGDPIQKANLARHLGALANHGGGHLIFGFKDDLTHDENRPSSLEKYNRDVFTAIVKRYLTPSFQCEVSLVPHNSGNKFPVIRAPSHGNVPIAAILTLESLGVRDTSQERTNAPLKGNGTWCNFGLLVQPSSRN